MGKGDDMSGVITLRRPGDYSDWETQVKLALMAKGLYAAINPDAPTTGDAAPTAADKEKAMGLIGKTVHRSLLCLVRKETDPKVAMRKLKDRFYRKTGSNLIALRTKFSELALEPGECAAALIDRLDGLVREIEEQQGEATVKDVEKISTLIKALPNGEYKFLKAQFVATASMAKTNDAGENQGLTYQGVCDAVLNFETTIGPMGDDADGEKALFGGKDKGSRGSGGQAGAPRKFKGACFECGKQGHRAADCKSKGKGTAGAGGGKKGACFECGRVGHFKSECPDLKDGGGEAVWLAQAQDGESASFVLDTGATSHIVKDEEYMATAERTNTNIVGIGGQKIKATAVGTLYAFPGKALLVPDAQENILSISQLTDNGWSASFTSRGVTLTAKGGRKIIGATDGGNLFRIDETCFVATDGEADMMMWHIRCGHQGDKALREMCAHNGIDVSRWPKKLPQCNVCVAANLKKAPVNRAATRVEADSKLANGQRVDVDLIGPMPPSLGGNKYAIQATDRHSRFVFTRPMKAKSQATRTVAIEILDKEFAPFQRHCEELRGDRGGEFTGNEWQDMCRERRIKRTYAATDTPSHNGLAEVAHRDTVKIARALLAQSGLPMSFWAEALEHATFLHNSAPASGAPHGASPYELWYNEKPRLGELKAFGCKTFYYAPGGKFGKRAEEGLYMGPSRTTVGGAVRVYCPQTKRMIVTRDFKVDESTCIPTARQMTDFELEADDDDVPELVSESDDESEDEGIAVPQVPARRAPTEAEVAERRQKAVEKLQKQLHVPGVDLTPANAGRTRRGSAAEPTQAEGEGGERALLAINGPATYQEAMQRADAEEWKAAAASELESLIKQGVFTVVERQPDTRCIGGKWVFNIKLDEDNNPVRYKGRYVARGFSQVPGVDYQDTSAPVVSKDAVRVGFAIAASAGFELQQFDIETAYLHATLEEQLYTEVPDGLLELCADKLTSGERELLESGNAVLRLDKALYGLKQAGRRWYETFRDYLIELGIKPTQTEPCVFVGAGVIILLYVDDVIIMSASRELIDAVMDKIEARFSIKRLGKPNFFVGWRIKVAPDFITVSQRGYIESIVEKFGNGARPKATPLVYGAALDSQGPPGDGQLYREIIGSLLFAAIGTRPDIATATSRLSREMESPTRAHVAAARGIVGYLGANPDLCLRYGSGDGHLKIEVYCDASFAPEEHNRKSRTGWVVLINGVPVAWRSALQSIIAHSTAEAEYVAMSDGAREAKYIAQLVREMGFEPEAPIIVHEDNQTAKRMGEEIATKRSKHIDVKYHHVRDLVQHGVIEVVECRTDDMLADILTKPLPKDTFCRLRDRLMAKGE